jgi:uncharacterized membrane protein
VKRTLRTSKITNTIHQPYFKLLMITILLLLRFFHILSGVFWAGVTFMYSLYLLPTVKNLGPDGGKFMNQLSKTNHFPMMMSISSFTTVVSGITLIGMLSNGFQFVWFSGTYGFFLSIGGILGIIAFGFGFFINRPFGEKLGKISSEIAQNGGIPSQIQLTEINRLNTILTRSTHTIAGLLFFAVSLMAIARYMI